MDVDARNKCGHDVTLELLRCVSSLCNGGAYCPYFDFRNILMLSLSKYEDVALVLRQAQDEGSVLKRALLTAAAAVAYCPYLAFASIRRACRIGSV